MLIDLPRVGGWEHPRPCYRHRADAAGAACAAYRRRARIILVLFLALALLSSCGSEEGPISDFNDGRARVAFMGDSITMGYLASRPSKAFTSLVASSLTEMGLETESELFVSVNPRRNVAFAQDTMADDPDIVLIEVGVHAVLTEDLTEDEFRAGYRRILDCIIGGDTVVVVGTVPWLGWDRAGRTYARAASFSEIIRQEAAEKDAEVADLWTATTLRDDLLSRPEDRAYFPPHHGDSFHPGDEGHALIARLYVEQLRDALKRPPERPYERECGRMGTQLQVPGPPWGTVPEEGVSG
jgi:lysophospholipase L1-like esterase